MSYWLVIAKITTFFALIFGVPLILLLRAMAKQARAGNVARFATGPTQSWRLNRFALAPLVAVPFAATNHLWLWTVVLLALTAAFLAIARRQQRVS